jgi:hypothetical protein
MQSIPATCLLSTLQKKSRNQPRAPMIEIQWQEWQDDLPDGLGPLTDGQGTPDGLP